MNGAARGGVLDPHALLDIKSTLISCISAARPKIAAYPFTTLVPNLGVVDWGEHRSFVVADIPGLIEGSHLGEGLGDQFLRHVERTSVILHLVDCSDLGDEPREAVRVIEQELSAFDASLLQRPRLLVATKMDASTSPERRDLVAKLAEERGLGFFAISAASGEGLPPLVRRAGALVDEQREKDAAGEARILAHPPWAFRGAAAHGDDEE